MAMENHCRLLVLSFLLYTAGASKSSSSGSSAGRGASKPHFETAGHVYQVTAGSEVVFPCKIKDLGNYRVVWRRGTAVLTAGDMLISSDSRYRLSDRLNLALQDVTPEDAGDFHCQVSTTPPKEITHTLEVLVPPVISKLHVKSGSPSVKKGTDITLECKASGNPVPVIQWTRKNNVMPDGEPKYTGSTLQIRNSSRHHSGQYQCNATNGVGDHAHQDINITVLYAPEINVELEVIRTKSVSGEDLYEAQLSCIVHAEPSAEVTWFRDTLRLEPSERFFLRNSGTKHTFVVRNLQSRDLGNYACNANNSVGRTKKIIELKGSPGVMRFHSHPGRARDSFNMSWEVESFAPILEYKLAYRKRLSSDESEDAENDVHNRGLHRPLRPPYWDDNDLPPASVTRHKLRSPLREIKGLVDEPNMWTETVIPAPSQAGQAAALQQSPFQGWYILRNLEPGIKYELVGKARSNFGWGKDSGMIFFATHTSDDFMYDLDMDDASPSHPTARDMSVTQRQNMAARLGCTFALLLLSIITTVM